MTACPNLCGPSLPAAIEPAAIARRPPVAGYSIGPSAEAIVSAVAFKHGVTIAELKSDSRSNRITRPRQEAFHALYVTGRYSLPTIGAYFGRRDHTTVLHGVRAHEARIKAAAEAEKAAA